MKLSVYVPGDIVPTARARVLHGAASTPRRTVEYQAVVARAVRAAIAEQGWPAKHAGPVLVFVMGYGCTRGDPDNILKGALDGLVKGHALADDTVGVIRSLTIETTGAGSPGLHLEVRPC